MTGGTVLAFLMMFGSLIAYSLLLLAVYAGRAYRNGYAAGLADAGTQRAPSNVTVLPRQRTTA